MAGLSGFVYGFWRLVNSSTGFPNLFKGTPRFADPSDLTPAEPAQSGHLSIRQPGARARRYAYIAGYSSTVANAHQYCQVPVVVSTDVDVNIRGEQADCPEMHFWQSHP
jgi:hypothetical protein